MNRRQALTTLAGAPAVWAANNETRPNLVFILIDDLRWNAIG